jgi:hypothetical protein
MLSLELLEKHIEECREYVEAGLEKQETLDFFLDLKRKLSSASDEDWRKYNELANHLPGDEADDVLIILKGQLLIEKRVREFIYSRMQNPDAFQRERFTASQCIAIGESMCLKNPEPEWLWKQIKELNTIRNKLAHNLEPEHIEKRIANLVSAVSNAQGLDTKSLARVVARLNGMLKGLYDVSESSEFSVK